MSSGDGPHDRPLVHLDDTFRCKWRRDRDSNPGDGFPPTRVPGVRLRPLGHLSVRLSLAAGAQAVQGNSWGWRARASVLQVQAHPAVLAALLLDLAKAHPADLTRPGDMGAAAGLQVDLVGALADTDEADLP